MTRTNSLPTGLDLLRKERPDPREDVREEIRHCAECGCPLTKHESRRCSRCYADAQMYES